MQSNLRDKSWQVSKTDAFWGEIAPASHVLQIYESEEIFLDTLAGFVSGGIRSGESVVVIATDAHLKALKERLKENHINLSRSINSGKFIALNAEETLQKFMVDGMPDEAKFRQTIAPVLATAKKNGKKIRAFGEMVALLWSQGNAAATIRLESLWNNYFDHETFSLFCAYPASGFHGHVQDSVNHICNSHSAIISGAFKSRHEMIYRATA